MRHKLSTPTVDIDPVTQMNVNFEHKILRLIFEPDKWLSYYLLGAHGFILLLVIRSSQFLGSPSLCGIPSHSGTTVKVHLVIILNRKRNCMKEPDEMNAGRNPDQICVALIRIKLVTSQALEMVVNLDLEVIKSP